MLNSKGPAATTSAAEHSYQPSFVRVVHRNDQSASDAGSELESSSEQSSAYSTRPGRPLQAMPHVPNGMRYSSPSQGEQPLSLLTSGYPTQSLGLDHDYAQYHDDTGGLPSQGSGGNDALKAFACTTCGKGFARRSDLARHGTLLSMDRFVAPRLIVQFLERIHSGVRPHVCDYPGCNKQFIQRSALTVHARVHTGEKPHMCERCGKVCHLPLQEIFEQC